MTSFKETTHNGGLDQEAAYAKKEQPGMESRFFVPRSWIGTNRTNQDSKDKTWRAPRSRFKSVLSPLSPLAIAPCSPIIFTIATIIVFNNFTWPFHMIICPFFTCKINVMRLFNLFLLRPFNLSQSCLPLFGNYSKITHLSSLGHVPWSLWIASLSKKQPSSKSITWQIQNRLHHFASQILQRSTVLSLVDQKCRLNI